MSSLKVGRAMTKTQPNIAHQTVIRSPDAAVDSFWPSQQEPNESEGRIVVRRDILVI
jgi:hypothetical protein